MLEWAWLLALLAGSLVGFSLGLVGGGGSILAVPLLVYVVGIDDPHVAIGTSAVAVAFNAAANLIPHARKGNVKWRCAAVFAARGVLGALGGAYVGQRVDGERLLGLFAALMVVVGVLMLVRRDGGGEQKFNHHRSFPGGPPTRPLWATFRELGGMGQARRPDGTSPVGPDRD